MNYEGGENEQIAVDPESGRVMKSQQSDNFLMKKSTLQNSRNELQRRMRNEAKLRVEIESRVQQSLKYKTLHFGLKMNHERNVAAVHPLMFLLRRIIYAVVIVFMAE